MISRVSGADVKMQLAESDPRVDLSMGKKIIEILMENERFRGSVGLTDSAGSQNLILG